MQMLATLLMVAVLLLATTDASHAEPITIALFGKVFAATFFGKIVSLIFTSVVTYAAGLLKQALIKKPEQPEPGIQFEVRGGDTDPIAFTMGRSATAGTRRYINTWGVDGKTPNAYVSDVLQIGDVPAPGHPALFVNGEACTILWHEPAAAQGYPVQEYRRDGKDHLWVRYHDGTQTTADPFLLDKFGSDPDRPWRNTMIGVGAPYLIVTARQNRDLFSGGLRYLFEPPRTVWYDLRKDSTAGGAGSHRWHDRATWEATDNPVVMIYNIVRGVYFNGAWLYGGRNFAAFRLPAANWMAGMNECDLPIDLAGGGTEPQYRAGIEVRGDMEPLRVVEELRKACAARIAEVGGIVKISVGAPPAAGYHITDGDILVTERQGYRPFPPLDDTYNGIEAVCPEPSEAWSDKEAPPRYSSDFEAEDGDQRLVARVRFDAVPYAVQCQRLMESMLLDNRKWRIHQFALPPEAYVLEPSIDVVSWTSERMGYSNKKFILVRASGARNRNQSVVLLEVDPSDHDWNPGTDERPVVPAPLGPIRPAPQAIVDWSAAAHTLTGADGRARPAILLGWDGDQDDVEFVRFEVRLAGGGDVVHRGSTAEVEAGAIVITQSLIANTGYEARGAYFAISGRPMEWSAWLPVTTPDVRIDYADLTADIQAKVDELTGWINGDLAASVGANAVAIAQEIADRAAAVAAEAQARADAVETERAERLADVGASATRLRDLIETVQRQGLQIADAIISEKREAATIRQEITASYQSAVAFSRAYVASFVDVAVGDGSAVAERLTELEAEVDSTLATLTASIQAVETAYALADANEAAARQALSIQLRGEYTGNDLSQVTQGLLYQERSSRIDDVQALTTAIDLISAGVGLLFDWIRDWSFNSSVEGWTGNGAPSASGGWLRPANHATDPHVISPAGLDVDATEYRQVKLRVRRTGAPTWEGQVWYKRNGDTTWDAGRRETVAEPTYADDVAIVTFEMGWSDTIDQIRVDLSSAADGTDYFEIDWVYIGRPSPGASQAQIGAVSQALSSAILAEAAKRETLSTILVGQPDPTGLGLGDLTEGLVHAESVARSTGDTALANSIATVQSALDAAEGDIDALSTVQATHSTQITALEGATSLNAAAITDVSTELDGKASAGAVDSLQSQIEDLGGGTSINALGQAMRGLRLTLDRLALANADTFLSGRRERDDLAGAVADVNQTLTGRIDVTDNSITLLGEEVTAIALSLAGYARLSITDALTGRVEETEDGISTIGTALTAIEAEIDTKAAASALSALDSRVSVAEGSIASSSSAIVQLQNDLNAAETQIAGKASAGALAALDTRVGNAEGVLSAQSTSLQQLFASLGGNSSEVLVKAEAVAGPAGYARYGISAKTGVGGTQRAASLFLDAPTGAANPTRVAVLAQQFAVWDGVSAHMPFVVDSGAVYMDEAFIRNLTSDHIDVASLVAEEVFVNNLVVRSHNIETGALVYADSAAGPVTSVSTAYVTLVTLPAIGASTATGRKRRLTFYCEVAYAANGASELAGTHNFTFELLKNGNVIKSQVETFLIIDQGDAGGGGSTKILRAAATVFLRVLDTTALASGDVYSVRARKDVAPAWAAPLKNINLDIDEFRRAA